MFSLPVSVCWCRRNTEPCLPSDKCRLLISAADSPSLFLHLILRISAPVWSLMLTSCWLNLTFMRYFTFRTSSQTTFVPFFSHRVFQEAPPPPCEQTETKRRGSRRHILTSPFTHQGSIMALRFGIFQACGVSSSTASFGRWRA